MDSVSASAGVSEQTRSAVLWINYDTLWFSPARPAAMIGASAHHHDSQQRRGARHAHQPHTAAPATKTKWLPRDSQTGEKRRYIPPKDSKQKVSKKDSSSPDDGFDPRVPPVAWGSAVYQNIAGPPDYPSNHQTMVYKSDNRHQGDSRELKQSKSRSPSYHYQMKTNEYEVDMPYVQTRNSARYRDSDEPRRMQGQRVNKSINQTATDVNTRVKNYEDCGITPASGYISYQEHSENLYSRSQKDSSDIPPTTRHEIDSRGERSRYSENVEDMYDRNRHGYSKYASWNVARHTDLEHQAIGERRTPDNVVMSDHIHKTDPGSARHDDRKLTDSSNNTSNENAVNMQANSPRLVNTSPASHISVLHIGTPHKSAKQPRNSYLEGEVQHPQEISSRSFTHHQGISPKRSTGDSSQIQASTDMIKTSDIQPRLSASDNKSATVAESADSICKDQTEEDTEPVLTASSIIKRLNRLNDQHRVQEQRTRRSTDSDLRSDSPNSVSVFDVHVVVSTPTSSTDDSYVQRRDSQVDQTKDNQSHQFPEVRDGHHCDPAFVVEAPTSLYNINNNAHSSSCNTHHTQLQSDHTPCDTDYIPQTTDLYHENGSDLSSSDEEDRGAGDGLNSTENDAEIARCLHESLVQEQDEDEIADSDPSPDVELDVPPEVVFDVEPPRVCAIRGLTDRELSALTSSKLQKIPMTAKCEICWDSYRVGDGVRHLVCAHFFHVKCIDIWLKRTATCPVCRTVLVDLFLPDRLHSHRHRRRRRCVIL